MSTTSTLIIPDSPRKRFERAHRAPDIIFAGLIALSPLALGGTHPLSAVILCALAALLCGVSLALHMRYAIAPRRTWPIYAIALVCAWTLLRSTPFFAWTNPQIAQDAWAIWPEVTARGGLAPGRAALWTLRTLTFVLAAWYATQRYVRSTHLHYVSRSILAGAYLILAVGVAQYITRAGQVLWFYAPLDWSRVVPLAGPFVNPNQAGAYVGLAAVLSAASARYHRTRTGQIIFGILTIPLVAYVFYVGARGAALATIVALGAWTLFFAVEGVAARRRALFTLGVSSILALSAIGLLYFDAPIDRVLSDGTLLDKINIWRSARTLPMHSGLMGLGPRAFQDAFSAFGLNRSHVWVEDPESGILQIFIEHGPILGAALCLMVLWIIYRLAGRDKHRRPALISGLCAAAVYIILETITGMGLHASSYLIAVGVLLGVALGRISNGAREEKGWPAFGTSAALFLLSVVALSQSAHAVRNSLDDSQPPLAELLRQTNVNDPSVQEAGLELARKTPGRPALIEQMARVYSAQGEHQKALHMAQALQRVAPNYAQSMRTALRVTIAAGQSEQACRLFQTYRERFGGLPTDELIAWHEQADMDAECFRSDEERLLVARAFLRANKHDLADSIILGLVSVPANASIDALLEAVQASQRMNIPMLAEPWVQEILDREHIERAQFSILDRWSRAAKDPGMAYDIARRARESFPEDAEFYVRYLEEYLPLSKAWANQDQYRSFTEEIAAARVMARGQRNLDRRLVLLAAEAAWRAENWEDAQAFYEDLQNAPLSAQEYVLVHFRLGEMARARNDYFQAKKYYEQVLDKSSKHRAAKEALEAIGN